MWEGQGDAGCLGMGRSGGGAQGGGLGGENEGQIASIVSSEISTSDGATELEVYGESLSPRVGVTCATKTYFTFT